MRVGLLVEGGVDEELLQPLLSSVLGEVLPNGHTNISFVPFRFPLNGYGEIPKNLKVLSRVLENEAERERLGVDIILVIHDSRKTEEVQKQIKLLLREFPLPHVYGLAVQEIEAWVLGDIESANRHVFRLRTLPELPHSPERDPDPKRTLTKLFVEASTHIEFDRWNRSCAQLVAVHLRWRQVVAHCPRGFARLVRKIEAVRLPL